MLRDESSNNHQINESILNYKSQQRKAISNNKKPLPGVVNILFEVCAKEIIMMVFEEDKCNRITMQEES